MLNLTASSRLSSSNVILKRVKIGQHCSPKSLYIGCFLQGVHYLTGFNSINLQTWTYKQYLMVFRHALNINQSNFYGANTPGEARLSGETAEMVLNSKINEAVP